MKKLIFGALACLLAIPAFAQKASVSGTASLTYATKDVWRGINFVDDSVLTGKVSLKYDNFSGFISGRMEMTNVNSYVLKAEPSGSVTAVRGGVFYTMANEKGADFTIGAMTHQYPNTGTPQTWEMFYGFDIGGSANFNVNVYQDIEVVKGYRVQANVSHEFKSGLGLPGTSAGNLKMWGSVAYGDSNYNSYYYGADTSTLSDLEIGASTTLNLGAYKVTPFLRYTAPFDPDILKGAENRTNILGGVSVSMSF